MIAVEGEIGRGGGSAVVRIDVDDVDDDTEKIQNTGNDAIVESPLNHSYYIVTYAIISHLPV